MARNAAPTEPIAIPILAPVSRVLVLELAVGVGVVEDIDEVAVDVDDAVVLVEVGVVVAEAEVTVSLGVLTGLTTRAYC